MDMRTARESAGPGTGRSWPAWRASLGNARDDASPDFDSGRSPPKASACHCPEESDIQATLKSISLGISFNDIAVAGRQARGIEVFQAARLRPGSGGPWRTEGARLLPRLFANVLFSAR